MARRRRNRPRELAGGYFPRRLALHLLPRRGGFFRAHRIILIRHLACRHSRTTTLAEHGVRGTERQTKRLEAFSDCVLAFAITLPIVQIQLPNVGNGSHLLPALEGLWRESLAYGMSVVAIGLYWAKAHFSGKLLEKTDHGYNLLSLLFLAAVSVLPLPTRTLALHIGGDDNSREATLLYIAFLML